jgi:BlaI family penicillinase repressor
MARPRSTGLTEGEQRIMEVLWKRGEASVQQVADVLGESEPVAYTTVLTMLRILHDKGFVGYRKEGKAHVYVPSMTRDDARSTALQQLIKRFFDGSPAALAQHLFRDSDIDLPEIEKLSAEVRARKTRKRK